MATASSEQGLPRWWTRGTFSESLQVNRTPTWKQKGPLFSLGIQRQLVSFPSNEDTGASKPGAYSQHENVRPPQFHLLGLQKSTVACNMEERPRLQMRLWCESALVQGESEDSALLSNIWGGSGGSVLNQIHHNSSLGFTAYLLPPLGQITLPLYTSVSLSEKEIVHPMR